MGCKFSILECIRGKVEQEKSISSETRSSLVTSDATETDRDEESPYLAFDKCRFVAEEDNHKVAKHKTDVLDIVDKKYEKSFFEDITHDENGDYLTIKEERPYGSARINRSKREANFLHGEYLIKGYNNTISQSNLLQMKDQVKIRFYENATNVKKCPRARRRAKIYKPLESTYLDKGEPKGPQDFSNYLLTTTVPSIVKILLVFSKDDQQMDMLATAARRLGWSVSVAKDAEKAIELFQNRAHELVIIDRRGHHAAEGDVICRTIRSSPMYYNSIIIALVKKSYFMLGEKDHIVALNLLETGFSRALIECSHEGILINELVGIYTSSLLPRTQLSAAHALYLALDRCRDMVHVTNDKNIIQFLNKISEKLLGYKTEEMMGRNLSEIIYYENFALMEQQLSKGREFEGNINCRRKNNQMITINCRIIPFCTTLKKPTHYIYVYDTTYLSDNSVPISPVGSPSHPPFKTSVLSNTRKSSDVKSGISEGRRPSSLQKLHTLQLEAPITKVITLLSNAVTDTNPETAAQISEAINILKTTELYVPHLKEDKTYSDPVATDLVGALLASPRTAWESRRSSSDSARLSSIKAITSPVSSRIQMNNFLGPHEIAEILDKSLNWNFEIFKLEVLTEKRPLVFLGLTIMNLYQVPAKLNCDEKTLQNWLAIIEHNYNGDNSYHNSTHAADVMQATARFMQSKRLKEILEPLDEVAALIAAAAHDIDHPGRSSQFLCNANNRLAILYNDLSVLESHHAALTFKLSLSDDSVNIFKNLEQDAYKLLRQNVIDMILATEMTKHFEHLAKFMNVCSTRIGDGQETYSDSLDMSVVLQPDNVILVKRMMIKCADVSNPTRPLKCCVEWARRIAEEYFNQTDEEKKLRLPVVMPMFDRLTCSIPKSQIGFVDYIINDMIEAWDVFIDMPEMVGYMRHNYEKWKEYNEKGISTLQDVEKLQQHPDMQIPRSS